MQPPSLAIESLVRGRAPRAYELVVLGTSAQVPTRARNHNGYVLRWGGDTVLFDPGEGTQRQLLHAGISASSIGTICITHFHGDHCLGLPGVLARFALDRRADPVDVYFPASGLVPLERLRRVASGDVWPNVRLHPVELGHTVHDLDATELVAEPLHHTVDAVGWRVQHPARRQIVPERAAALGIQGRDVGRLVRQGTLTTPRGVVRLEEVSRPRTGPAFAFVMDTAVCDGAVALAADVDLLVCEATYQDGEEHLARDNRHLTARQAAWVAREAGANGLVLTHFSQRHVDESRFAEQAQEIFPEVVAARDLSVVEPPARA